MAAIRKRGNRWRADIRRKGHSESKTFTTKAQAVAWASEIERQIEDGAFDRYARGKNKTLGDVLERYGREVSPTKASHRWENNRINWFLGQPIADLTLLQVTTPVISDWVSERLKSVLPSTINRDLNLLSSIFTTAIKEWQWVKENPVSNIKRPQNPHPRHRRIEPEEIDIVCAAAGYEVGSVPETLTELSALFFLIGIETALRLSEIASITEETYQPEKRCIILHGDKGSKLSQRRARRAVEVPLSRKAMGLIELRLKSPLRGTGSSVGALFSKVVAKTGLKDLHFHDTRHEALTRMADKVDLLNLAKIARITEINILKDVYYNPKPEDIASKLD